MREDASHKSRKPMTDMRGGNPLESPFGLLVQDTCTGLADIIPYWFESSSAVAEFLQIVLKTVFFDLEDCDFSDQEIDEKVENVVRKIELEGLKNEQLRGVSDLQNSSWRIIWWGSFTELCVSQEDIPVRIRALFRGHLDGFSGKNALVIADREKNKFVDFIEELGS